MTTQTLRIYGASDDCVELEGAIDDEFYVDGDDRWTGLLTAPDGMRILVFAEYTRGTWAVGAGSFDEDIPFPDWPVSIVPGANTYSAMLVIEVPVGTIVKTAS